MAMVVTKNILKNRLNSNCLPRLSLFHCRLIDNNCHDKVHSPEIGIHLVAPHTVQPAKTIETSKLCTDYNASNSAKV